MKSRANRGTAFALVAMLFLSMMVILPSYAVTFPEIYLVPSADDFGEAPISSGYK